jgi:catechol 2,3-dioxygenase-like lactoylglutathione lyase family enzyme
MSVGDERGPDGRTRAAEGIVHGVPMIAVEDVRASADWYCQLLGCRSDRVSDEFDRLRDGDGILLLLHARRAGEHGAWAAVAPEQPGDGFLLWFLVDDFDAVHRNASSLRAEILVAAHRNEADDARELVLRDPDGYALAITEHPSD